MAKYLALHLGLMMESHLVLIIEAHLGLMMNMRWVPQMAPLMVPMMANMWVYCLVIHLDKIMDVSSALHMVLLMACL